MVSTGEDGAFSPNQGHHCPRLFCIAVQEAISLLRVQFKWPRKMICCRTAHHNAFDAFRELSMPCHRYW
ncbi:unnamed protein product [Calypogeia fissa]